MCLPNFLQRRDQYLATHFFEYDCIVTYMLGEQLALTLVVLT